MPRKPNKTGSHYDDAFPTRLRTLLRERCVRQDDLKEALGVKNRQSVTGYTDGNTAPTADKIVALAKYFDVSTDYLLGMSEVQSVTPELVSAAKYTGLSEKSAALLADFSRKSPSLISSLSFLLEDIDFYRLVLSAVTFFLHHMHKAPDFGDNDEFLESATDSELEAIDHLDKKYGAVAIGPAQIAKMYSAEASDQLRHIMNEHLNNLLYPPSTAIEKYKQFQRDNWYKGFDMSSNDREEGNP